MPKELDEKVGKMHFSALGAELIVMSGEVCSTGTSPKADCGASCYMSLLRCKVRLLLIQEVQGTMEVPQGQYIDRIVDVTVSGNTKYVPSEQCTSRQHRRRWRLFQQQSSMFQKDGRDPPSAVH